jgi:hypothetical protein
VSDTSQHADTEPVPYWLKYAAVLVGIALAFAPLGVLRAMWIEDDSFSEGVRVGLLGSSLIVFVGLYVELLRWAFRSGSRSLQDKDSERNNARS